MTETKSPMFRRMAVYSLFYTFKIKEGTQARLHEGGDWVMGMVTGLCVLLRVVMLLRGLKKRRFRSVLDAQSHGQGCLKDR